MNIDTGKIRELTEDEKAIIREVLVEPVQMTEKQKREKRVSLHDHRSPLGRRLTAERARLGLAYVHLSKADRRGKTPAEIQALRRAKEQGGQDGE